MKNIISKVKGPFRELKKSQDRLKEVIEIADEAHKETTKIFDEFEKLTLNGEDLFCTLRTAKKGDDNHAD